MTRVDDIAATVRTIAASTFAADEQSLNEDTSLRDDLGADSLGMVEMLVAVEQELGVELPDSDEEIAGLDSVGDVVRAFDAALARGRDDTTG